MVVAPPSGGAPAFPAGRAFLRDLGKAYLAFGLGLPTAIGVMIALQSSDELSGRAAITLGPLAFLIIFFGYRARSIAVTVARVTGAYAGWLSFLVVGSLVALDQWIFAPLRGSGIGGVLGWVIVCFIAAAFIAAGHLASELVLSLTQRLRRRPG